MVAIRLTSVALVILSISACTSYAPHLPPVYERGSTTNGDSDPVQDVPVAPTPQVGQHGTDTQSATLALLNQSQRARNSGATGEAAAYVERAIRLNPRQADLWLRLAELHLEQNDLEAAIQYANKTITLAGQRMDWVQQAWLLIADARAAQGDIHSAEEIRTKWQTYRG